MTVKTMESIDERQQKAFHDLVRFIKWEANRSQLPGHWLMSADDLEAEMYFVLVKIIPKYIDKPYKEFLIIARVCLTNAVGALKHKVFLTGRRSELTAYSFNDELDSNDDQDRGDRSGFLYTDAGGNYTVRDYFSEDFGYRGLRPEFYVEQAEQMEEKYNQLSEFDKLVLDALLGGNERIAIYLDLQRKRKNFVYTNPTIAVTALTIARALCEPEKMVTDSFERIKNLFNKGND